MNIFFDFEFVEDEQPDIMPISLGMVCGATELDLEFQFDQARAERHDFVRETVLPLLEWAPEDRFTREQARDAVYEFVKGTGWSQGSAHPTFWAWFAATDWVLLYKLWGGMLNVPPGFPHMAMDLQQLFIHLNRDRRLVPPKNKTKRHHALVDARWDQDFGRRLFAAAEGKGLGL